MLEHIWGISGTYVGDMLELELGVSGGQVDRLFQMGHGAISPFFLVFFFISQGVVV